MNDIPEDIREKTEAIADKCWPRLNDDVVRDLAEALMAERDRWKPAVTYFERYCQDEASEDGDLFTGCSQEQHEDAKAFASAIRRGTP